MNHPDKKKPLRRDPAKLCDMGHMADEYESTDVLGSYTGMGRNGDPPVQDQDDL